MSAPRPELRADDVRHAARVCRDALWPLAGRDWAVGAGNGLEWTARQTLEHLVETQVCYARDLATPVVSTGDQVRLVPESGADVVGLLDALEQAAAVHAAVVAAAPAEVRGYHPFGMADAAGFAAMACDELLVHTDDIAAGLGAGFQPPSGLCARVLARLYPWAPVGGDAWQTLRWANGRTALGDRPRLAPGWRWHPAPLDEWDGRDPTGA